MYALQKETLSVYALQKETIKNQKKDRWQFVLGFGFPWVSLVWFSKKFSGWKDGQGLGALADPPEDLGSSPIPTWQFTMVSNSNPKESNTLTQAHMQAKHQRI